MILKINAYYFPTQHQTIVLDVATLFARAVWTAYLSNVQNN
jgi:hypothetical protein